MTQITPGLRYPFALLKWKFERRDGGWNGNSTFLELETILAARREISSWPGYKPTPLHELSGLARSVGVAELFYKDEGFRFELRSFKGLGAGYAVLRLVQRHIASQIGSVPTSAELRRGTHRELAGRLTVTAATDGNHGRAIAWGSKQFGCRSVIYIPSQCSPVRQAYIEAYGASVERTAFGYDDTLRVCVAEAERQGWIVISDTSWEGYETTPALVMQGYSVMTGEILEQLPAGTAPTHVFVQGGVGGLAATVCAHFAQHWGGRRPKIVVVEPEGAACLYASALAGKPTPAPGEVQTIMAGLSCKEPSALAWTVLEQGADFFLTISDEVVADCMKLLAASPYGDRPIVAGETAVAGLAGFLCVSGDGRSREELGLTSESRVLFLGTEGDTDPVLYEQFVGASSDEIRRRAEDYSSPDTRVAS